MRSAGWSRRAGPLAGLLRLRVREVGVAGGPSLCWSSQPWAAARRGKAWPYVIPSGVRGFRPPGLLRQCLPPHGGISAGAYTYSLARTGDPKTTDR